jgi:hypothetical protein
MTFDEWLERYLSKLQTAKSSLQGCSTHQLRIVWDAALANAPLTEALPNGWKLVPVEPTNAMFEALYSDPKKPVGEKWDAMLAAVPGAPRSPQKDKP